MVSPIKRLLMALGLVKKPQFTPEGDSNRWIGRDKAIISSVRPQGSMAVPAGRPSSPATRPYVIEKMEKLGDDERFLKVSGLSFGEEPYPFEIQEDLATHKIWCHCGCPDTTYRFEVVNAQNGFSSVRNSNGAFPVKTNPSGVPSVCKHIEQVLSNPVFNQAELDYKRGAR